MTIRDMFFTLVVFSLMTFTVQAEETWKIASLDWEPYSGSKLTNQGNSIQKLQEVLRKEGIRLIVEFYPWKRAQIKAGTKEFVGYFPAWPEEVAEGFVGSKAVDWSRVGVIRNTSSNVEFSSIDELFKKYKVGLVKTYVYPKEIQDAAEKYPNRVEGATSEVLMLKKLSKGRQDVAITDPDVIHFLADQEGISNIETIHIITQKELVLAFREGEDNAPRIKLLNKLLSQ